MYQCRTRSAGRLAKIRARRDRTFWILWGFQWWSIGRSGWQWIVLQRLIRNMRSVMMTNIPSQVHTLLRSQRHRYTHDSAPTSAWRAYLSIIDCPLLPKTLVVNGREVISITEYPVLMSLRNYLAKSYLAGWCVDPSNTTLTSVKLSSVLKVNEIIVIWNP